MSNEQQIERMLVEFVERFEEFSKKFVVTMDSPLLNVAPKWYGPKEMFLRLLRIGVLSTGAAELQIVGAAIHGAIDCLGFSGTLKLLLEIRRKQHGRKKQQT